MAASCAFTSTLAEGDGGDFTTRTVTAAVGEGVPGSPPESCSPPMASVLGRTGQQGSTPLHAAAQSAMTVRPTTRATALPMMAAVVADTPEEAVAGDATGGGGGSGVRKRECQPRTTTIRTARRWRRGQGHRGEDNHRDKHRVSHSSGEVDCGQKKRKGRAAGHCWRNN